LPHQVYKRPAAIVDALVVALKAKFFQDPQRRFVACPHGWPDSVAPRCERRIHHSVCSLSCAGAPRAVRSPRPATHCSRRVRGFRHRPPMTTSLRRPWHGPICCSPRSASGADRGDTYVIEPGEGSIAVGRPKASKP